MLAEFGHLSNTEIDLVLKAPILTSILIAGADGNIDRKEIQESIKVAQKNAQKAKARLMEFYQFVGEDFEDKLKILLQSYPSSALQRNAMIVHELTQLNPIFASINKTFAKELYTSMKDIALKTAESSGGLLGIKSIGQEEAQYIGLHMIKDPSTY